MKCKGCHAALRNFFKFRQIQTLKKSRALNVNYSSYLHVTEIYRSLQIRPQQTKGKQHIKPSEKGAKPHIDATLHAHPPNHFVWVQSKQQQQQNQSCFFLIESLIIWTTLNKQ